jgi:drug/metabolite transporter (DMT)-like permease
VEPQVFAMVLASAVVHATWNALVKLGDDRLATVAIMSATQIPISLVLLTVFALPAPEAWPYLLGSVALSTAYILFLQRAYRAGDFALVYPLARGLAPLIVAAISVLALGEILAWTAKLAILFVSIGIFSLSLSRGAAGLRDWRPVAWAAATGCFIGCYTVLDGLGARASGDAHGYMAWMSLLTAALTIACAIALRGRRAPRPSGRTVRLGALAGVLSYASAWTVIWAMTLAPLPLVSALRETGIVFAAIIGVVALKEKLDLARCASIATTMFGAALLKFSR